jgi:hypothetical protein
MGGAIFQFQSLITTVVNSISGTILGPIQTVAYVLLTISLVLGIYEAYVRGGDIRSLATTFIKYAVAAFVIGYWTNLFSDSFTGFNQLASAIDNSYGAWDMAQSWWMQLLNYYNLNGYQGVMNGIPWTPAGVLTLLEIVLAYLVFPFATLIFTLIYTFWGSCLFAVGPLVVALAPSSIINSLSKYYALNLGVWNAWVVLYAVLGTLISAINGNDVNALANGGGAAIFGGWSGGVLNGAVVMIGFISIIYALCILAIPLVAGFILRGQFSGVSAGLGMAVSRITGGAQQGLRGGSAAGGAMGGPVGSAVGGAVGMVMGAGVGAAGASMNLRSNNSDMFPSAGSSNTAPPNTPEDTTRVQFNR